MAGVVERCRLTWATRCKGEWDADRDSKRCEVLGIEEDMSDDEGRMGSSESLSRKTKLSRGEMWGLSPPKAVALEACFSLSTLAVSTH